MASRQAIVRAPVAALTLVLGLAACFRSGRSATPLELRVVSWNIQAGGKGLDSIADVLRSHAPDVAGLQEVDVRWSERSAFVDQARELGRRLGMEVCFAPIYSSPGARAGDQPREFGVALMSRLPIVRCQNDTLTRLSTQVANAAPAPMPGLLAAVVRMSGHDVRFFNTHLDYRADPEVRRRQVAEMVQYIERSSLPTVVTGDLNAPPEASELQPLLGILRDAWSVGVGTGQTYPADKPVKRIDYVLASGDFTVISASVPLVFASDHRPVVTRLVLRTVQPRR